MSEVPHIIKYMGSKRNILDFVTDTIVENSRADQRLYDVFGGSAVVSGGLRNRMPVTCNDIQVYTSIIAKTYLNNYFWNNYDDNILEIIVDLAQEHVDRFHVGYPNLSFDYSNDYDFATVLKLEEKQKQLVGFNFNGYDHLFSKNYSGTYWSYEQCLWIDALSNIAKRPEFRDTFLYDVILSSLMFAMAYTSQSTGHYAQYRDLTTDNLSDILLYRRKTITPLFKQKFNELRQTYSESTNTLFEHRVASLDYLQLLENHEEGSIVYADPPYQFVHYSRFYHALETLVRYDYPVIAHKGRYRTDRHQSPFCISTKVKPAFADMFRSVARKGSTLVLSYSETGMITYSDLLSLAQATFGSSYEVKTKTLDHIHSTMGRQGDKSRDVKEVLIICSPKT